MALSISTAAELSSRVNLRRPSLVTGVSEDVGLRAGRIVGRFDKVVIACRRECYSFTAGRSPRQEHRNGRLDHRFDDGIFDIARRGVEEETAVSDEESPIAISL